MTVNEGKPVIYFPPFLTSDFLCFVSPAGRFMKFPFEAHINPPMWKYYSLFIAVKCMEFYCNKMTIYIQINYYHIELST